MAAMYIINEGRVKIFNPKNIKEYKYLSKGEYFGEHSFFQKKHWRKIWNAQSITFCSTKILLKSDFAEILDDFPNIKKCMKKFSIKRQIELNKFDKNDNYEGIAYIRLPFKFKEKTGIKNFPLKKFNEKEPGITIDDNILRPKNKTNFYVKQKRVSPKKNKNSAYIKNDELSISSFSHLKMQYHININK